MQYKTYRGFQFFRPDFHLAVCHVFNRHEDFNIHHRFTRDFWKITYVIHGKGKVLVDSCSYPISPGSILLIHPRAVTTYDMESPELEIYNIVFDRSVILPQIFSAGDPYDFFAIFSDSFNQEKSIPVYILSASRPQYMIIRDMEREYQENFVNWHLRLQLELAELLILFQRNAGLHIKQRKGEYLVPLIDEYLEKNYTRQISIQNIAERTEYSPSHLCYLYRKHTGVSLLTRLQAIRVRHAEQALRRPVKSIADISYGCGFQDLSNFYRVFKKIIGCSPGKYRRNYADLSNLSNR